MENQLTLIRNNSESYKAIEISRNSQFRQVSKKKVPKSSNTLTLKSKKQEIRNKLLNFEHLSPFGAKGNISDSLHLFSPTEDYIKQTNDSSMIKKYFQSPTGAAKMHNSISEVCCTNKTSGKRTKSKSKSSKSKEKLTNSPEISYLSPKTCRLQKINLKPPKPTLKKLPKDNQDSFKNSQIPTKTTIFQKYHQNEIPKNLNFSTSPKSILQSSSTKPSVNKETIKNSSFSDKKIPASMVFHSQRLKTINEKFCKRVKFSENIEHFEESSGKIITRENTNKTCISERSISSSSETESAFGENEWIRIENIRNFGETSGFVKDFVKKIQDGSRILSSRSMEEIKFKVVGNKNKEGDGSEKGLALELLCLPFE
ncbi:hypothetical protein SteCoe_38238 [Stentor coeruleus]|uniref:Uncharacterized protein n=1 Tax=Stentor coeruleus TaxID=5963 RepID=A0A1R2ALQ3_9CILI|nr:hypothetical protein SteCoe_38238 [Stentor coeruleus]